MDLYSKLPTPENDDETTPQENLAGSSLYDVKIDEKERPSAPVSGSVASELQQNRLFKGVAADDLAALEAVMSREQFKSGDVLFQQGDPGLSMYIILTGRVRIFIRDNQGNEVTFRTYGTREIFGEFAILDQQPRSASASAVDDVEVLSLSRDNFLRFLKDRPLVGLAMMRSLAERIRYTTLYLEKVIDWTSWLSKGDYEQVIQEMSLNSSDDEIQQLIRTFIDMVQRVRQREDALRARGQAESTEKPSDGEQS